MDLKGEDAGLWRPPPLATWRLAPTGSALSWWPLAPLPLTGTAVWPFPLIGRRVPVDLEWLPSRDRRRILHTGCVMVGDGGLEPPTSCVSSKYSNQLS